VWVLTSEEHRNSIQEALAREPASVQFVFLDWPRWLGFLKRTRAGFELQQYCWQILAYVKARELHEQISFDLAHHVTVCRYWMPSLLPFLGIPFIWGPVGGGESAPKAFWRGLGWQGALLEAVRELARFLGEHDPLLRLSARRATLGVATTHETAARMRRLRVPTIEVCTQVALTEAEVATLAQCPAPCANGAIRFISIGRLVPWKGFHLGLQALARMRHTSAEYWIVGGGPAERSLKALAGELGVEHRVRFLGQLPREDVLRTLRDCDVLVHPSMHESGGAVCAEVMGAGRPVICLDLGGPGLQVTPDCGFRVPAREPGQVVQDMAIAMDALTDSPALCVAMGKAARLRVTERLNTQAMRTEFRRWYREVTLVHRNGPAVASATTGRPFIGHRMRTSPTVSAVMPTYNKGPWLQQAIDSVISQTFTDWELIIVDDGSTDDTADVLARCTDPRIRIQTLAKNVGRAAARNIALQQAQGRYIAICDSDDVSDPTRFEQHVAFLDSHSDIGVVSAYIRQLSEHGSALIIFPTGHEAIARRLARGKMGAAHGASMIRTECFEQLGPYCGDLRTAEDFELFRRFSFKYRFHTLPQELLQYRNPLGAVPLRVWAESMRAHRYAVYRANCYGSAEPVLSFDEFARSWRTRFAVHTVDSLRFAHFNLRTHVFSSHVLR